MPFITHRFNEDHKEKLEDELVELEPVSRRPDFKKRPTISVAQGPSPQ